MTAIGSRKAIYGHFASKEDLMLSALEAAPAPDYSTTLNDQSRPLRERVADFSRGVAAEAPGDTGELAMYLEFFAALLRAPDALQRYASARERRLQELAGAAVTTAGSSPRGSPPSRSGPSARRCWSACRSKSA
jgi:AcrR family transcriptional regulator